MNDEFKEYAPDTFPAPRTDSASGLETLPAFPLDPASYASIPTVSDLNNFQRIKAQHDRFLQLAPDVFAWLVSLGPDWEARADAILRREMLLNRDI